MRVLWCGGALQGDWLGFLVEKVAAPQRGERKRDKQLDKCQTKSYATCID